MLKQRRLAAHWKVLTISAVAVGVTAGLAIALPASMASTHPAAGPMAGQSDRAKDSALGAAAHATRDPRPRPRRRTASRVGCMVRYTPATWPGSFLAQVTISNRGKTSIHGWTLTFRFPGDEAISGAWNATFTQTGAEVSVRNLNWDATIPRGASQSFGFMGAWQSNNTAPASFRVNGMPCS
jgi:cellulase/cellobiase CelA1